MSWLLDLIEAAQAHTWVMVFVLWLTVVAGGKLIHGKVQDNGNDIEDLAEDHQKMAQEVHAIDLKQDHIVERQEVVLDKIGVNEQEIQELREEQARLDIKTKIDDAFYRGDGSDSGDD